MTTLIRCLVIVAALMLVGLGFYVCLTASRVKHASHNRSVMVELIVASPPLLAAGVDFVLEGLYALKKIGRSEERGYHASESPVRRPREDKFRDEERTIPSIPQGKKKYYN